MNKKHPIACPFPDTSEEIRKLCSHDIKSPLSAIMECCSMLFEKMPDEPFLHDLHANINDAIESIWTMIERIHALVLLQDKVMPFHPKPVNITAVVRHVEARLEDRLKAHNMNLLIRSSAENVLIGTNACRMRGDDVVIGFIVQLILRMILNSAQSAGSLILDILQEEDVRVMIKGQSRIHESLMQIQRCLHDNDTSAVNPELEWRILYHLCRMSETSISCAPAHDDSWTITVRFPILPEKTRCPDHA
ncbi:hypothetical protein JW948_05610 [bacterium]|nr:hypothetical protein [bacterium]